jgi:hypothetical protein
MIGLHHPQESRRRMSSRMKSLVDMIGLHHPQESRRRVVSENEVLSGQIGIVSSLDLGP